MKLPVKILEISGYPPPYGGWTMRTEQLKKRLESDGYECVVLNTGQSRRTPSPHYETVMSGWDYVRKVWRFCRSGFLVHTHANGEAPKAIVLAILAEAIASLVGRGSVLTFHAGTDQLYFPRANGPRWTPVLRLMFRIPRAVICNSEGVRARILEYGLPPERVIVIPAFSKQYLDFRPSALPEAAEQHFKRWPRSFFSYLALRKTFSPVVLIDAFERISAADPATGLIVCGIDGHPESDTVEAFHARVHASGLADRICLLGDMSHDQFLTAMTRSAAYLRMPVSDGVCSSVLEALALGVVVVASDNGTRPSGVITFVADDASDLARKALAVARRDPQESEGLPPSDDIPDTVGREVGLLASQCQNGRMPREVTV